MKPSSSPTVCRWELGAALRQAREQAGVSQADAAAAIELKAAGLSKIENGKQTIRKAYVQALTNLYGLDDDKTAQLVALTDGANQPEWFTEFRSIPEWFRQFLGYESAASEIFTFSSLLIDGLLQLPNYTMEIGRVNRPGLIESELAAATKLRKARQVRLLGVDGPRLHWIIDEPVLRRPVGGVEQMKSQINYLITMSLQDKLTIQVLQNSVGAHPGMTAPFSILKFVDHPGMDTIYLETGRSASYLEADSDLKLYQWRWDVLSKLALPPGESRDFLATIMDDL